MTKTATQKTRLNNSTTKAPSYNRVLDILATTPRATPKTHKRENQSVRASHTALYSLLIA